MKPVFDSFSEPRTDRRKFLLGLLFCSAAGIAQWRRPYKTLDYLGRNKLDDLVPKKIGPWNFVAASGLVLPPDDPYLNSIYSQLLTRVYSDGQNPPIMLLLAQSGSQTGFLQIHRPETCYTAGGYQISPLAPHSVQVGTKVVHANSMDAWGNGAPEHVVYWTRIGNMMPLSWREQKIAVAKQNLEGVVPDAILVRFSMVNNDADAARASIDSFIRAMIDSVAPNLRSVFIA
jgi:EpsI family protein